MISALAWIKRNAIAISLVCSVPSITIGLLVRDKVFTLPYFLGALERLIYPKDAIRLDIHMDNCYGIELAHGNATGLDIIRAWTSHWSEAYDSV